MRLELESGQSYQGKTLRLEPSEKEERYSIYLKLSKRTMKFKRTLALTAADARRWAGHV